MSASDVGVLLTDLDHVALACNRRFGEVFGIRHEQVVLSAVEEVRQMVSGRIPDLDAWATNLVDVYDDPERVQVDVLELQNPPQVLRRFTGPVHGQDGQTIARLWTFQDVTREHQDQERGEVLQRIALFHDEDPVKVFRFATEAVGDLYGSISVLSVQEGDQMLFRAVGGPPSPIRDLLSNPLSESYCQFCLQASGPLVIQDGREHDGAKGMMAVLAGITRYAGVPLHDPAGRVIGTFCILDSRSDEPVEPTDLRFLELVAMKMSSELERERQLGQLRSDLDATTQSLAATQRQLVQSEKLAVTGTLSASVAHDIRNILAAVALDLELGSDDPEATLASVRSHLDRFSLLAQRLLSYARPRMTAHASVDAVALIERVLSLLDGHARMHDVRLVLEAKGQVPDVIGEPGQLELLFVNLILNAIQAMPQGGKVTVTVVAERDRVLVSVKDTGNGVPAHIAERLFEPFSSTRPEGFGLGLFSCRRIAEDHGGSIALRSSSARGSTFAVTLPLP